MFTYTLGGNAFLLGHQRVSDDGGFVYLNQGNVVDGNGRPEGNGGTSFYLFTDAMINGFVRAGENTTFGQYTYDFAAAGVPGLKASVAYLQGTKTSKSATGWQRCVRVGARHAGGLHHSAGRAQRLRRNGASWRLTVATQPVVADKDQTRLIFNYTYSFL